MTKSNQQVSPSTHAAHQAARRGVWDGVRDKVKQDSGVLSSFNCCRTYTDSAEILLRLESKPSDSKLTHTEAEYHQMLASVMVSSPGCY